MTFSIIRRHSFVLGLVFLLFLALLIFAPFVSVEAATANEKPNIGVEASKLPNPLGKTTIADLLKLFLEAMVRLGIPIAILFLVYTGFLFIKAQGNQTEIQTAKRSLLYTVIGIGVLIGAQTLAAIIDVTIKNIRG